MYSVCTVIMFSKVKENTRKMIDFFKAVKWIGNINVFLMQKILESYKHTMKFKRSKRKNK